MTQKERFGVAGKTYTAVSVQVTSSSHVLLDTTLCEIYTDYDNFEFLSLDT
jgi:hypothetical protein